MSDNNILVSLVVPTKNRYPYLFKLIELLKSFNFGPEFELVVQDNNDDNAVFKQYIACSPYVNLKYYYDPNPIPIGLNCDRAIRNSRGDYVCFIGDDDCITKNFMPCIRWMQENKVDCVFPRRIMYFWPDYCDKGDERASVHYEDFTREVSFFDTSSVLKELLDTGCVGIARVPMIYHGIVSRGLLDKIWEQCGTYFPGASPDIASAISLCMVTDKYASFRFPIIIAGNSRTGGGGQKILRHHAQTDFSKLPFLPKQTEAIWDKRIPKIWSNATIWCESVVEALHVWGRYDLADSINYEALYSNFAINYFYYRKMAYSLTNNKLKLFFNSCWGILEKMVKEFAKWVLKLLHVNRDKRIKVYNMEDIKSLCDYFETKGFIFEQFFHANK